MAPLAALGAPEFEFQQCACPSQALLSVRLANRGGWGTQAAASYRWGKSMVGRARTRETRSSVVAGDPAPGRHLLVASTGGHLAELERWSKVIGSDADSLWVTCESLHSASVLRNRRVLFHPYVAPRDAAGSAKAFLRMRKEIDWAAEEFSAAVTTGAALGVVGLAAARLQGVPSFYYESVSRVNGPSLSGKLAGLDPGITRFCQYEHWAKGSWTYRRSLFDSFASVAKAPVDRPKLFVTLGTIQPYRFDAMVDAVMSTGLADDRTVWQLGATKRTDLPGTTVSQLSSTEFAEASRGADVVLTHAGVGTIMNLLDMGISPVVTPRRSSRKEHVDDHQCEIAGFLRRRALASVAEVEQLDESAILGASGLATERRSREDLLPANASG
ncbi:glycosyltransferase [Mycolicibacterium grossiae]|uniref:glycosyltransferase n=1 Tax=Mycolicibacterium grossiae TaxID=1552759 RepID=UPI00210CEC66|nr:glycosyltransferase [Mycolicibacterium grossiae]